MEIAEIIERAKKGAGIDSDMQLSKHLGLSKSAVANWRAGTSYPNTVSCERLAGLTGIPLARVLGIVGEARAISREEKQVWRKLAASAAAAFLLVGATLLPPTHANASPSASKSAQGVGIMRNYWPGHDRRFEGCLVRVSDIRHAAMAPDANVTMAIAYTAWANP